MKTCILIRHGATDMAGRFCGNSDPPLNNLGRVQIECAAAMLPMAPETVYTSDLLRARQSAEILAAHFAVPVRVRPGLREIGFGSWEGLRWQEIEQRFPSEWQAWIERYPAGLIPSGERYESFLGRLQDEIAFLTERAESESLAAVTHGGFIRTALTELGGVSSDESRRISAEYGAIVDLSRTHVACYRRIVG